MIHPSRWGWHPCDYATYRLLKRLHHVCEARGGRSRRGGAGNERSRIIA